MTRIFDAPTRTLLAALAAVCLIGLLLVSSASASGQSVVKVSGRPMYTTMGGATPLPTDRTVPHWYGTFTDPTNGVTYGYNMVGTGDPRATHTTTTVPTEIIPLNFTFSTGKSFNGSDTVTATLGSPVFQRNSYSTAKVTRNGKPQALSGAGTTQLEDATMRSQFNQLGRSAYHLLLDQPSIAPTQTIAVPANHGVVASFGPGFNTFGDVDSNWFSSQMNNLINTLHIDPGTVPIFLTNNVYLYDNNDPNQCCVLGFHGASHPIGIGGGETNGQGNNVVQTFIYAAYAQPGTWATSSTPASPDGADGYYIQDIHPLSHEVSEWADDPFVNNTVNPWLTPTAPQYGCTNVLETGDPVVGIGLLVGSNPYFQTAGANADGYWHPEDEAFLPWFARQSPNTTSEQVQNGKTGRYTFFGDLNPYPGFQVPATGC